MSKDRVAVALSGGMDSSAAAYLLKKSGYRVEGVHALFHDSAKSKYHAHLAENICTVLNIPFRQVDLREEFRRFVIDYFYQEYRRGRTPNPCLACNRYIKFGLMLEEILSSDINYMATGHYARSQWHGSRCRLLKAVDQKKDQSYFLYMLNQEKLRFLKKYFPFEPGDMVDTSGKLLGRHQGIAFYTIGQRHGLGLVFHEPMYVIRIDPEENKLFLGEEAELYSHGLIAGKLSWILKPPASPVALASKIRYRSPEVKSTLSLMAESACVRFQLAQRAVTPGQAVVFYQEEEVLGGGIIERAS